jgi:hypothetical protein
MTGAVALLVATGAIAGTKDVNVVNTVGVDVLTLPDDSINVDTVRAFTSLSCEVENTGQVGIEFCSDDTQPSSGDAQLLHTVSLAITASPGADCTVDLSIIDVNDNGFTRKSLLVAAAGENSAGSDSLSFRRPILMEGRDLLAGQVFARGIGTCRMRADILLQEL